MKVEVADFAIASFLDELPAIWPEFERHAALVEAFDLKAEDAVLLGIAIWLPAAAEWPTLLVSQRFSPSPSSGFFPSALFVPETKKLFVGAGTLLLGYDVGECRRLWEDHTTCGLWGWRRHGEVVLMSGELELAGYDIRGERRWSIEVEPPWSYIVERDQVTVDIMGQRRTFELLAGPTS